MSKIFRSCLLLLVLTNYVLLVAAKTPVQLQAAHYSGKHINLNFQNIKVRAVLQLLAQFTGMNMVVSDAVSGSISLQLHDVPWDQALAVILKTRGLTQRKVDNVIFIAPVDEMLKSDRQVQASKKQMARQAPLKKKLIKLHYAKAADIVRVLTDKHHSMISPRGSINVDNRTNSLWLEDSEDALDAIMFLIRQLDIPEQQVLIEAKIVVINSDYEKELGVDFNRSYLSQANSNRAIASSPKLTHQLNLDLNPGIMPTTGLVVANLGRDFLVDLELSALESDGKGEIIASPRLITENQHTAVIESGEEIPYQEATLSGATATSFKKAVLSLKVTPYINADNKIMLDLKVNQDTTNLATISGIPSILTREIKTKVLVNNQETVVLGGIYRHKNANTVQRVPFLGNMPIIGVLFTKNLSRIEHEELLIFITPKIML